MNIRNFKNIGVAKIIDSIFINLAIFAIVFILARSNSVTLLASYFIACVCTMCIFCLLKIRNNNKQIELLDQAQIAKMQECINQLMLSTNNNTLDFFVTVFAKKFDDTKIVDNCVLVAHNGIKTAVFCAITPTKLTETQLCEFYSTAHSIHVDKILILTAHGQTPQTQTLAQHLPELKIVVYNDIQVYRMLRSFNHFPDIKLKLKKPTKARKKELLRTALSAKNSKKYLILSFIFIAYAYFFGSVLFYLSFAAIGLALAMLCKLKIWDK